MSAIELNAANLDKISSLMRVPTYSRKGLKQSLVHIGVGGFHRAHQAVYLDDLLHRPDFAGWGLCGVGLLPQDERMYKTLKQQDYLYTVVERSAAGEVPRVIGSITNFLFAPEDPEAVLEKLASPETRIVSLTITEGGYYVHQGTGEFDAAHPDIVYDLAHPDRPKGAFGYLAEALNRRRLRGLKPFTAQSCDNLQNNGDVLRKMLLAFARLRDPGLADWITENVAFPSSMVDRITPATTDEHRNLVSEKFGIVDGWPVVCEPFRQWVVEDHFPLGRPEWEKVGAQMTADVLPYEKMKIRLLNSSHQTLCYIGMLLGYQFAHQTMEDPLIQRVVRATMDHEVTPLLSPVPGVDLEEYKKTLMERFSNPTIRDQLSRIGTEGSARIPKFVLPSILDLLDRKGPIKGLTFTVAAWFRYLTGLDDSGKSMPLIDPMGEKVKAAALLGGRSPQALLALREIFPEVLSRSPAFVGELTRALNSFYDKGALETLKIYADEV